MRKPIALPARRRTQFVSAQNLYPKYQVQNTKIKKNDRSFLLPICQHQRRGRRFLYYFSVYVKLFKERIILSDGISSELRSAYL